MLTQKELQRVLSYDPDTGLFTRLVGNTGQPLMKGNQDKYVQIRVLGRLYYAQRLAVLYMTGRSLTSEFYVDHVNGKRNDNRWENLRVVEHLDNCRNQKRRVDNTSGTPGVQWVEKTRKWMVRIGIGKGHKAYLGQYTDLSEAVELREFAEEILGYHKNHGRASS